MKKIIWYEILCIALCLTIVLSSAAVLVQHGSNTAPSNKTNTSIVEEPNDLNEIYGSKNFGFAAPISGPMGLSSDFYIEWEVTVQADDLVSLKDAISATVDGTPTSIELTADITFTGTTDMIVVPANKIIQIISADISGAPFTIDAAGLCRVIAVNANGALCLEDITVTGGYVSSSTVANAGGGVRNEGILVLNAGTVVSGNTVAGYGGGIYNSDTFLMNEGSAIFDNRAQYGGGIINYGSAAVFTMNGGAIRSNTAYNGGGVYNYSGGTFTMNSGEISGHKVSNYGGGVYNAAIFNMSQESDSTPSLIADNKAYEGGGVYNYGPNAVFNFFGGTISGNSCDYTGGGICNEEKATINMSGGVITGNKAVLGNTSSGFGGGMCNWYGTVTMTGGAISGNEARFGGGVFNYMRNVFDMSGDALISDNSGIIGQYSSGGGVYNYGYFTMYENATISDNIAPWGGGIFNEYNKFTMESGTISGNSSTTGNGGAFYVNNSVDPNSNIEIKGGTISGNSTVANGGGIWVSYDNLNKVKVASGVIFSDNVAASARSRDPADDALYESQIGDNGEGVVWTVPFTQGYNNFDIGYPKGTLLILVTFMQNHSGADDTVIEIIAVDINTAIGTQMPSDPARTGYEFTGWNAMRDGSGADYTDSDPNITENTVLYAQWKQLPPTPPPVDPPIVDPPIVANKYKVTYNGNGNTSGVAPVDYNRYSSGASVTVLGPGSLIKTDHTFLGWATYPGASSATYPAGSSFRIFSDTNLYAVWKTVDDADKIYTVTFVDWDDTVLKVEQVPYGGSATAPPDPSREGYVFIGWDKPFDNVTSDLTVRALYEIPIGSPPASGEWALLNLILAWIGVIIVIAAVIAAIQKERKRKDDLDGTSQPKEHRSAWMLVAAAIASVVGVLFFFLTEDVRLPMTIVDQWTVISLLIFIVVVITAVLAFERKEGGHKVFKQNSSVIGGDSAEAMSPYSFKLKEGCTKAVSYRIGKDGQWKLVFPDGSGIYTIPGEEILDDIYLEHAQC